MTSQNIPPFRGGQGRSDSDVERDGEGALMWALAMVALGAVLPIWRLCA